MTGHRLTPSLTLMLALFTQSAQAFFDPPWITPEQPRAGETVFVNIHGGFCDALIWHPDGPQITREGGAIRLVADGVHVDDTDWCIYGEWTTTFAIGALSPGDYVLTVDLAYTDFFGMPSLLTIGVVPFTVQGTEPTQTPVPASGWIALSALSMLIACASLVALRRHLAS